MKMRCVSCFDDINKGLFQPQPLQAAGFDDIDKVPTKAGDY